MICGDLQWGSLIWFQVLGEAIVGVSIGQRPGGHAHEQGPAVQHGGGEPVGPSGVPEPAALPSVKPIDAVVECPTGGIPRLDVVTSISKPLWVGEVDHLHVG